MTNKFSEALALLKLPKDGFGLQAKNSDNDATKDAKILFRSSYLSVASPSFSTGTGTVFQSLGSIGQEHKNNNDYPTNRHIQSIEEETVQPNTNTVKTTSKHPMEKYKL